MFREEASSALAGFLAGPLSWLNRNLEVFILVEGEKPENPEKNLGARQEPTSYSTHTELESSMGHIGGGRPLSTLRHP